MAFSFLGFWLVNVIIVIVVVVVVVIIVVLASVFVVVVAVGQAQFVVSFLIGIVDNLDVLTVKFSTQVGDFLGRISTILVEYFSDPFEDGKTNSEIVAKASENFGLGISVSLGEFPDHVVEQDDLFT